MKPILIFLLFSIGCCDSAITKGPYMQPIEVGANYTICCCRLESGNPFTKIDTATVIVTAMKHGWVQYVWDFDIDNPKAAKFSRSVEDFNDLINQCK